MEHKLRKASVKGEYETVLSSILFPAFTVKVIFV